MLQLFRDGGRGRGRLGSGYMNELCARFEGRRDRESRPCR